MNSVDPKLRAMLEADLMRVESEDSDSVEAAALRLAKGVLLHAAARIRCRYPTTTHARQFHTVSISRAGVARAY